ncbi:MAG: HEPN domain-containing protein [Verrucomicrobiota bacterium]|nr:HEPN domain-containing protein [Verrucomicrobiota bacterium]
MGNNPIPDTAIYHTQQCAEKILKAFLCARAISIPKTHDIVLLTEMASEFDKSFETIINDAGCLTPFATAFRYPGVDLEPDITEVNEAIEMAETIMNFTKNKIEGI